MSIKHAAASIYFLLNCLSIFGYIQAKEKVLVITHSHNRPDFIELQHKTFKAFLQDDYEFVVFNDASTHEMAQQIEAACQKCAIRCIRIPQEIHTRPYLPTVHKENPQEPAYRCAHVVQYSLDVLGFEHQGIVAIVDSDMFLIKPFSIETCLTGYNIVGHKQERGPINYLWNGLLFINMNTLPDKESFNVNCGIVEGHRVDVGGYLYYYLRKHPEINIRYYQTYIIDTINKRSEYLQSLGFDDATIKFIQKNPHWMEFHVGTTFLHYRAGGNWNGQTAHYHQQKTDLLIGYLKTVLDRNNRQ